MICNSGSDLVYFLDKEAYRIYKYPLLPVNKHPAGFEHAYLVTTGGFATSVVIIW